MSSIETVERKVIYTAEVVNQGGRAGKVTTENKGFSLQLVNPAEDPDGHKGTNPEQLFAAAYAACFHGALAAHAEKAHLTLTGSTVTARVTLYEDKEGGYQLGVELRVSLPGIERPKAEKILHQAHATCPYSKAVRNNVEVRLTLD
jgi:osmotically inducible protein OsmC